MSSNPFSSLAKLFVHNQRLFWHQNNLKWFEGRRHILDIGSGKGLFAKLAPDRIVPFNWTDQPQSRREYPNSPEKYLAHRRQVPSATTAALPSATTAPRPSTMTAPLPSTMTAALPSATTAPPPRLPFEAESFDGVYCADVIEHFGVVEARELLEEALRVLQKGGRFVLATPYPSKEFWCDPTHVRPYPPEALLSYFVDDSKKGDGNNPTFSSIPYRMKLAIMRKRYRPLVNLPLSLFFPEDRYKMSKLFHPFSIFFMLSNLLARIGVLHPRPEGFVLVLDKEN